MLGVHTPDHTSKTKLKTLPMLKLRHLKQIRQLSHTSQLYSIWL